jgi:hypothetical protein
LIPFVDWIQEPLSLQPEKVVHIAWFGNVWFRNGVGSEKMVQICGSKMQDFSVHFRARPEEDHACDSKVFGQPEAASQAWWSCG